jgi:hypothetical protein
VESGKGVGKDFEKRERVSEGGGGLKSALRG